MGKGAIVCTGTVTVTGAMNLSSDLVALVAEKDVTINGRGRDAGGTRMQGLVYTKGSFRAKDSTVIGAIVSAQVDGTTQLDRVNLVEVPGATNFEVVIDTALEQITQDGQAARQGYLIGIEHQGGFTALTDSNSAALRELARTLAGRPEGQRGRIQVRRKNPDGSPGEVVSDRGLPLLVRNEAFRKTDKWNGYVTATGRDSLQTEEIFKLDLNSFLSVDGDLKMLLWKSYRKPWN